MLLKKSKKIIFLTIGVVLIGLIGWKLLNKNGHQYSQYSVERRDITETIELSGEIDAKLKEDLRFLAGGLVTYFPWKEGDEIKKYSTVASLDARALKKSLTKQLNLYASERHDFDSTQDLYQKERDDGDVDQALRRILEKAQYDLTNSVIDVELQDLSLTLSRLYAPFTGILVSAPITTPNVNVLATNVFTLVDPTSLYFLADLDESDLNVVVPGLPVKLELDAYPNDLMETTVESISYASKVTSTGTTYEITIPIPLDKMSTLRLGLNGTASIILSAKKDILTLPIEAVSEENDRRYVLVMDGKKTLEKDVKVGISNNNFVEITSGLSEGDVVVLEK
ncbi:MAG: efflux RND transporter periplasmic adaptor subunit [bacterium]